LEIKRILGTILAKAPALGRVVDVESVRKMRETLKPAKVGLDDTCFLQFTSGSTSRPKGVVLTHANLSANVRAIMEQGLGASSTDTGVSWLPLYHDMGLIGFVIAPLYQQNSVTFLSPLLFLKRPARWLSEITRHHATVSFGPNFAYALCVKRIRENEMQDLDLSTWRVAGCGAEPIRSENLRAFADKFAEVGFDARAFVACYGMAESTLAVSFSPVGEGIHTDIVDGRTLWEKGRAEATDAEAAGTAKIVGCGGKFEGHDIGVFALDDLESAKSLPAREVGEIRLRGPSVMPGYYNEPDLTKEAFAGGWLRTGDMGYLVDGNVHICGRSKDVIIVNGRNYYPQDLEWEAGQVKGVRRGNVIAFGTMKPNHDRERVVISFETAVAAGPERKKLKGEVRRVVQQAVGLTVDDVVAVDVGVLPKTSSGKLQRGRTREHYERGELLDRTSARELDKVGTVKELAKSQLGYFRHAISAARESVTGSEPTEDSSGD